MHRTAYDDIIALRGYDEFKELAKRLKQLGENRRNLSGVQIRMTNFLFAEAPGAGVTTQLRLLTRLLAEQKLTPFMGEKRFFEWILNENAFERGGSFDRLLAETDAAAGFYSRFCGVVGLELDTWSKKPRHPGFRRLLDFVEDMYGQIVFVFVTEEQNEDRLTELHQVLNEATPVELVHCPLPSADDMAQYLLDFLWARGFAATQEAKSEIEAFMPRLIQIDRFDGMQTMSILADEIVFRVCSSAPDSDASSEDGQEMTGIMPLVQARHLSFIAGEGGYIDRRMRRRQHRLIGFERGA